mmetsp:Transcript_30566/g.99701  ORF Transcript_30566/g.99701 Transcript_30566/m.99701 type:complete len:366 (+) Transcript_30566:1086-2183(+)
MDAWAKEYFLSGGADRDQPSFARAVAASAATGRLAASELNIRTSFEADGSTFRHWNRGWSTAILARGAPRAFDGAADRNRTRRWGGGEGGGAAAGDHGVTAGPRSEKPRFQKDEHVVYVSEHPDAGAVVLEVHADDPPEYYYYTIMLEGAVVERQVPEGRLRPTESDGGEARGAAPRDNAAGIGPGRGDASSSRGVGVATSSGGLWNMDAVKDLRHTTALLNAAGVRFATAPASERLPGGIDPDRFPMLALATSQRADFPPIGCEDCHWEAVDLDSSGDCVVAACAWELRRLLPEALLVAHGLLTLAAPLGTPSSRVASCASPRRATWPGPRCCAESSADHTTPSTHGPSTRWSSCCCRCTGLGP